MLTVIAAGEPPEPKQPEDLRDGLFTAHFVEGRSNLRGKCVTSRSHVVVRVVRPTPSSVPQKHLKYKFQKRAEALRFHDDIAPRRHHPSMSSPEEWKVKVIVVMDKRNISGGDMVLAVKRQVCDSVSNIIAITLVHFCVTQGNAAMLKQK